MTTIESKAIEKKAECVCVCAREGGRVCVCVCCVLLVSLLTKKWTSVNVIGGIGHNIGILFYFQSNTEYILILSYMWP